MNKFPVEVGSVVTSRAGRDAGRPFLVIRELDQEYVLIADGGLRTMDRPKKKKRRHLKATGRKNEELRNKLMGGEQISDEEIRLSLSNEEG
jgi:ribosomal protein L14E/L6E/L27E